MWNVVVSLTSAPVQNSSSRRGDKTCAIWRFRSACQLTQYHALAKMAADNILTSIQEQVCPNDYEAPPCKQSNVKSQNPVMLESILEVLHNMQLARPAQFRESKFRIQKRGFRDLSRAKNFFAYSGPDPRTRQILVTNAARWHQDPGSFWVNSIHPAQSSSSPSRLVEFYIRAQCDDA